MKRLLLCVLFFGLVGCSDKETGLKKEVINSNVDACINSLTESLKSPSSLKLSKILANYNMATIDDVYQSEFNGLETVKDVTDKFVRLNTLNYEPRTLFIAMEYEAQNSFGAMLKGYYGCKLVGNGRTGDSFKVLDTGEDGMATPASYSTKDSFWYQFKTPSSTQGVKVETTLLDSSVDKKTLSVVYGVLRSEAMKQRMKYFANTKVQLEAYIKQTNWFISHFKKQHGKPDYLGGTFNEIENIKRHEKNLTVQERKLAEYEKAVYGQLAE